MKTFHVEASPINDDIPALDAMRNENEWIVERREGEPPVVFMGRLLGYGSSRRIEHNHGVGRLTSENRNRCPGCRWFEVRIFRIAEVSDVNPGQYFIYTLGPSIVPGERTFVRADFALTGFEVIELCTVRHGERGEPYMPAAAARALSQAAGVDRDIQDAYVNRAVA